jgi:hypothetical protein
MSILGAIVGSAAAASMNVAAEIPDTPSWLPGGLTVGSVPIWALLATVLLALFKIWPAIKRLQNESDASLRTDLMRRVTELEKHLLDEQRECDRRISDLQSKLDGVLRQFLAYQLAVEQAVPPDRRSPAIDSALESLRASLGEGI